MTVLLAALLIVSVFAALAVKYARGLYRQLSEVSYERDNLTSELEVTKASYQSLLTRANTLSQESVEAKRLVNQVEHYIGGIKDQLKDMLAVHFDLRRALEHIAGFRGEVEGGNYTATLKEIAAKALPGLTLTGTVEEVAARLAVDESELPSELVGKNIDNFVAIDSRNARVDLSGQAARIKATRKATRKAIAETVGQLQDQLQKPLIGNLDEAPLDVASRRLETKKMAVDTVPGLTTSIVVVDDHTGYGCAEGCSHSDHKYLAPLNNEEHA